MKQSQPAHWQMECLLQLWQFWRPSAWADALGFFTGYKRWLTVCYPIVSAFFVWSGLNAMQYEIKHRGLAELFWSGARLDLWVLALCLVLAVPACGFYCIRLHAADGDAVPEHLLFGERRGMAKVLGQTFEAGRALRSYLQSQHAQSQQLDPANMHKMLPSNAQAVSQGSSFSPDFIADIETGTPVSGHGIVTTDEEARAAFEAHLTIVRNLTARLSKSARLLYGVVLTEPWEVFEAFKQ